MGINMVFLMYDLKAEYTSPSFTNNKFLYKQRKSTFDTKKLNQSHNDAASWNLFL